MLTGRIRLRMWVGLSVRVRLRLRIGVRVGVREVNTSLLHLLTNLIVIVVGA